MDGCCWCWCYHTQRAAGRRPIRDARRKTTATESTSHTTNTPGGRPPRLRTGDAAPPHPRCRGRGGGGRRRLAIVGIAASAGGEGRQGLGAILQLFLLVMMICVRIGVMGLRWGRRLVWYGGSGIHGVRVNKWGPPTTDPPSDNQTQTTPTQEKGRTSSSYGTEWNTGPPPPASLDDPGGPAGRPISDEVDDDGPRWCCSCRSCCWAGSGA